MKELMVQNKHRFFRILFAFDPRRTAILLADEDKRGDKRFCERTIPLADSLYERHLAELERRMKRKDFLRELEAQLPPERVRRAHRY